MKAQSKPAISEMTWNPVTGCTKVSPGCDNCYGSRMAHRLQIMGAARYSDGFQLRVHEDALAIPHLWNTPRIVFVAPASDLFHEAVPLSFIERTFEVMEGCPQHQFQILTKRAERLREVAPALNWAPNICMGVSIESQEQAHRAEILGTVPAATRFLALEPLLGPIDELPLEGIHWVTVGNESGPRARPMELGWVESIVSQCQAREVALSLEQWGAVQKYRTARARRERMPQRALN